MLRSVCSNLPCSLYLHHLSLLELGIISFYLTQVRCPAQDGEHRKYSTCALRRSKEVKEGRERDSYLFPVSWILFPLFQHEIDSSGSEAQLDLLAVT